MNRLHNLALLSVAGAAGFGGKEHHAFQGSDDIRSLPQAIAHVYHGVCWHDQSRIVPG